MNYALKHGKITAFLAGTLSVVSFAPYYFIPAAFIGFSLLLYLLLNAENRKKAFFTGYSFGFAHFAFGFSWIGEALMIEPEKFGWLYPVVLFGSGTFFGLFFAFPAALAWQKRQNRQQWLMFGAWLVIFEWLRSFFLTGFPWNLTGYTLAFSDELIQSAAFGGTYLLSLAAVLTYSVGGLWLQNSNKKTFIAVLCWILLTATVFWSGGRLRLSKADDKPLDTVVRIVQPSIPQTMKWSGDLLENNFNRYIVLSSLKLSMQPDIIVWGETASPFMLDQDEYHRAQILPAIPDNGFLVAGMITRRPDTTGRLRPYNSLAVIDKAGNIADYYHKSHLVPFGEYIPLRQYLPDFVKPLANSIGTFGRGSGPQVIKVGNLPSFGGIICYEAIFPHEIINPNERPEFLINLTNDGWYGNSAGPYQHWTAARLRAVEEGIPLIRAANNGISGLITAYGREAAVLPLNYTAVLDVRLTGTLPHPTVYARLGNGVSLTFCLILLFLGFIKVADKDANHQMV